MAVDIAPSPFDEEAVDESSGSPLKSQRYVAKIVRLELSDHAQFGPGVRWVLSMYDPERKEVVKGFDGGEYVGLRHRAGGFVVGLQTGTTAGQAAMIDHLSFAVGSHDELLEHRSSALASGLEAGAVLEEAASWNVRLRDPDGLAVELTAAKPRLR